MIQRAAWLQGYLEEAIRRKMCVQIHCTTCGAHEFRKGLWGGVRARSPEGIQLPATDARALADCMAALEHRADYSHAHVRAVRMMLFEICSVLGHEGDESELERTLRGTWAGKVLADMKSHWLARRASQRAHDERAANAPRRREEKRRVKAERHALRLAAKAERDRAWREKHKDRKP